MSYTAPQYVDTKEQAIIALASTIKGEAVTGGDGSVNRALDILADVLAEQDVQVPQTDAGAILALAQYVSGGGGGGEDKEFIAAIRDRNGFKPFTGTLSVGGEAISYTVETFFAGTEDEFEGAVASVPAGSIVTYAITESGTMNVFESKEAFLNLAAPPILSVKVSDSVVVPAGNFLVAMFNVSK